MSDQVIGTVFLATKGGDEQRYTLRDGQSYKIGRDALSDIVIEQPGVSRLHATLSASANGIVVADASSLNGTYVNGIKIHSMRDLTSRDVIDIGSAKMRIELASDQIVENLSGNTSSRAMTAQMKPVSVSVMVASIADFHRFSEVLPTNDLAEMQFSWIQGVRSLVTDFDGKVDKVIGASLVAVWIGNDPKNLALRAARTMQKVQDLTAELSRSGQWPHNDSHPWKASVILTSGFGLKGALGANSQQSAGGFTIVGDPINAAFELGAISNNSQTQIIIDESTSLLIEGSVKLQPLKDISLPGGYSGDKVFSVVM